MKRFFIFIAVIIGIGAIGGGAYAAFHIMSSKSTDGKASVTTIGETSATSSVVPIPQTVHVATPEPVKALYMSSWVAASPKPLEHVLKLIDETEANAVVLDIKDATGRVSFLVDDPTIKDTGSPENRIKNIKEFLEMLHSKNIYVIGRISTFQDPYLAKTKPEWAIHKKSDSTVWKDKKGLPFLDPANPAVVHYLITLGKVSYELGFDEINYDYIRYPSDGNVKDIDYKLTEGKTRADTITAFAEELNKELKQIPGLMISADLFGLTTTEKTDMGIGQMFDRMIPYFDYIAPMIYPSHYNNGEYGIKKPAESPYETITKALAGAKSKTQALATTTTIISDSSSSSSATSVTKQTTLDEEQAKHLYAKVRPWLQDFSIRGTTYDAAKVRAQIKATYDSGLTSWMMWDPSNKYTRDAYEKAENVVQ